MCNPKLRTKETRETYRTGKKEQGINSILRTVHFRSFPSLLFCSLKVINRKQQKPKGKR